MDRNYKAALSPREIASLRRLTIIRQQAISDGHRQLLASMNLIALVDDEWRLTDAGRKRLRTDERDSGMGVPSLEWQDDDAVPPGPLSGKSR